MVAEAGALMGTDSAPPVENNKGEDSQAERLKAKRAAMKSRKHVNQKTPQDSAHEIETSENEARDYTEKIKKRRKFRKAPWLCEHISVREIAAVRSDVDDVLAFLGGDTSQKLNGMDIDDYEYDLDFVDYEMQFWDRHRKSRSSPKFVKYLPDLNFTTKRKLDEEARKVGKKVIIKCDVMSRLRGRDEERSYAKERIAENVYTNLARLGLKRKNELEAKQPNEAAKTTAQKPKPYYVRPTKQDREESRRKGWRKPRWSQERKEERVRVPHEFELHVDNVEQDDPEETDLMCFLLDLQNRDISPEDYDMLLRLSDKIAPKTVADDKLASLRTATVSHEGAGDISWTDALCAVCMDAYEDGQDVKILPCEHFFHTHCIEMWLNNSGNTCPLDGLEV